MVLTLLLCDVKVLASFLLSCGMLASCMDQSSGCMSFGDDLYCYVSSHVVLDPTSLYFCVVLLFLQYDLMSFVYALQIVMLVVSRSCLVVGICMQAVVLFDTHTR